MGLPCKLVGCRANWWGCQENGTRWGYICSCNTQRNYLAAADIAVCHQHFRYCNHLEYSMMSLNHLIVYRRKVKGKGVVGCGAFPRLASWGYNSLITYLGHARHYISSFAPSLPSLKFYRMWIMTFIHSSFHFIGTFVLSFSSFVNGLLSCVPRKVLI